jgi:hypothetical protein
MRYVTAFAVLLALSSASAMGGNDTKGQFSDSQIACAAAATEDYFTTAAALVRRAMANGLMSVDDTIAQRRLVEGYCKQWAACLVSNMPANTREMGYRATFSGCLDADTNEQREGQPSEHDR